MAGRAPRPGHRSSRSISSLDRPWGRGWPAALVDRQRRPAGLLRHRDLGPLGRRSAGSGSALSPALPPSPPPDALNGIGVDELPLRRRTGGSSLGWSTSIRVGRNLAPEEARGARRRSLIRSAATQVGLLAACRSRRGRRPSRPRTCQLIHQSPRTTRCRRTASGPRGQDHHAADGNCGPRSRRRPATASKTAEPERQFLESSHRWSPRKRRIYPAVRLDPDADPTRTTIPRSGSARRPPGCIRPDRPDWATIEPVAPIRTVATVRAGLEKSPRDNFAFSRGANSEFRRISAVGRRGEEANGSPPLARGKGRDVIRGGQRCGH